MEATELINWHNNLINSRKPWENAWQDLADHFLPLRYRNEQNPNTNLKILNDKIVDSTGILAMRTLAAGLQGGMTSPARPWFSLTIEDSDLAKFKAVQSYMEEVGKRMRSIFNRSNFYNVVHNLYAELGTFGTGFMLETADFENGFRFMPLCAGSYALDINDKQRVDVLFRKMHFSPRQLIMMFGKENLPSYITNSKNSNEQYPVIQAIYPRTERDINKNTPQNKAFASVYWLDSANYGKPKILKESGFDDFPGFGVRWDCNANDIYGKSPAMDVLPDCRMLQQMSISTLKAMHKAVDPPLSVSASLKSVGLDLTPGAINYVENMPGQSPQAAQPILQTNPQVQNVRQAMLDVQKQIQNGLYNDLFRMLMQNGRSNVTATEIAAKEEEKLILIGPVLERLHDELFIPLIDRTYNLMAKLNMLPLPPKELQGREIKIEFVSLLAQAQKMVSTSAIDKLLSFTVQSAQAFPQVLDAIDIDNTIDNYARYLGTDANILRTQQERDEIRKVQYERSE